MLLRGGILTAAQAKNKGLITEVFIHDSFKEQATASTIRIASQNKTVSTTIFCYLCITIFHFMKCIPLNRYFKEAKVFWGHVIIVFIV